MDKSYVEQKVEVAFPPTAPLATWTPEFIRQECAAAITAALEDACKAQCPWCAEGDVPKFMPPWEEDEKPWYQHHIKGYACDARAIRSMMGGR